jgi:asparagine synthase (glutamine-hydrolysing)
MASDRKWPTTLSGGWHHMGTTRMHRDPKQGVVDPDCRVHGLANRYVVGAGGRDPLNQSLYVWSKTFLPNYILSNLGDRMEMAHSVEGRLPFLDHHVAAEAARMPVSMKIKGMTEKYVLREATKPVLTEAVYRRQKHPFMSPPATMQRDGRLYALLQDTLRGSLVDGPGIYDRRKVVALLDSVPSMDAATRTRADTLLMWVLSICLLHDRLGMSSGAVARAA